jgi:hypothetical protein
MYDWFLTKGRGTITYQKVPLRAGLFEHLLFDIIVYCIYSGIQSV